MVQDTRGVSSVDPNSNGAEFSFAGDFCFPVEKNSFQINPNKYGHICNSGCRDTILQPQSKTYLFFSFAAVIV